jgi:hypothetical protein
LIENNYIGPEIGKFKTEYDIRFAYFISNKTYCLVTPTDEIIKAKGVTSHVLSVEDFKNMYFKNKDISTSRTNTSINYEKAYVDITHKDITLRHNSYQKRVKLYKDGL